MPNDKHRKIRVFKMAGLWYVLIPKYLDIRSIQSVVFQCLSFERAMLFALQRVDLAKAIARGDLYFDERYQ